MGQYGKAALEAVRLIVDEGIVASEAWEKAISNYTNSEHSQAKACPRNAFLGLCDKGLIRGVKEGSSKGMGVNRVRAIEAVIFLRKSPSLANNKSLLWEKVATVSHDGQMDVVTALWNNRLIAN